MLAALMQSRESTPVKEQLNVIGTIPSWLCGSLVRTGPARFDVGSTSYRHWFDGLALIHHFTIQDSQVSYQSKYLESSTYKSATSRNGIYISQFGTFRSDDPCQNIFKRFMSRFMPPEQADNCNVSIHKVNGQYLTQTETRTNVAITIDDVNTVGPVILAPDVNGQTTTAHPHVTDSGTYNMITQFGPRSYYNFYRLSNNNDNTKPSTHKIVSIPVSEPSYIHSFGLSERYIILVEYPLQTTSLRLLAASYYRKSYIENFQWHIKRSANITIINKETGELLGKYITKTGFFAFHHVNAYESRNNDNEDVINVDIIAYDDASIIDALYLDNLRSAKPSFPASQLRRYVIPIKAKSNSTPIDYEVLSKSEIELPRLHPKYRSQPYRYVYGVGRKQTEGFLNQIVKLDTVNRSELTWNEADCHPSEPIFVPAPTSSSSSATTSDESSEDDGVVLSVVVNAVKQISYLLILDARTMNELGRAEVPYALSYLLHGLFVPSSEEK